MIIRIPRWFDATPINHIGEQGFRSVAWKFEAHLFSGGLLFIAARLLIIPAFLWIGVANLSVGEKINVLLVGFVTTWTKSAQLTNDCYVEYVQFHCFGYIFARIFELVCLRFDLEHISFTLLLFDISHDFLLKSKTWQLIVHFVMFNIRTIYLNYKQNFGTWTRI